MSKPQPGDPDFVPPGGINCERCVGFLIDYAEGALSAEELRSFESHTRACPPCGAYLANYTRVAKLAAQAGAPLPDQAPPPQRLIDAILQARRHAHGGRGAPPGAAGHSDR